VSLTRLLIGINVAVFGWMLVTGGGLGLLDGSMTGEFLYAHGGLRPEDVTLGGQWWRLISAAFVHLSLIHIAMNMIALNYVGAPVEWLYGKVRFALLYLLAILGSSLAVVYFSPPDEFTAGASGAIFGLFGALVAAGLRLGQRGRSLITSVIPVIVLNLVFTFAVPNISAAAHIGGLITGFVAGLVLFLMPSRQRTGAYAYAFSPNADAGRVQTIDQPAAADPATVETIDHPPDAGPHEEADAPPLEARDPRE
jgi:membrane associated rhomboid family serine protease